MFVTETYTLNVAVGLMRTNIARFEDSKGHAAEDSNFQGSYAASTGKYLPTFRKISVPSSSGSISHSSRTSLFTA